MNIVARFVWTRWGLERFIQEALDAAKPGDRITFSFDTALLGLRWLCVAEINGGE